MTKEEVLSRLRSHFPVLSRRFGIAGLYLFGSVVRNEAEASSDIDLLVDFHSGERIGLFRFIDLKDALEGILGASVDLVTRDALKDRMIDSILKEAVRAA